MAIVGSAATAAASAVDHFDAGEFDEAIRDHGTPALWRRSRICPCRDSRTRQAALDCTFCEGGLLWDEGEEIRLFAFNRKRNDIYDIPGQRVEGATSFTFPTGIVPGHLDMLVLQVGQIAVNNEVHVRDDVDNAGRSTERLRVRPAFAVEFVEAIVDGNLEQYQPGVHLTVNDAGDIGWLPAQGPPAGSQYTMRYLARPTYIAWSPYSRDEGGRAMPYRTLALRYDFFDPKAVGES